MRCLLYFKNALKGVQTQTLPWTWYGKAYVCNSHKSA